MSISCSPSPYDGPFPEVTGYVEFVLYYVILDEHAFRRVIIDGRRHGIAPTFHGQLTRADLKTVCRPQRVNSPIPFGSKLPSRPLGSSSQVQSLSFMSYTVLLLIIES